MGGLCCLLRTNCPTGGPIAHERSFISGDGFQLRNERDMRVLDAHSFATTGFMKSWLLTSQNREMTRHDAPPERPSPVKQLCQREFESEPDQAMKQSQQIQTEEPLPALASPQGAFQDPGGCLTPQLVPNPIYSVFSCAHRPDKAKVINQAE